MTGIKPKAGVPLPGSLHYRNTFQPSALPTAGAVRSRAAGCPPRASRAVGGGGHSRDGAGLRVNPPAPGQPRCCRGATYRHADIRRDAWVYAQPVVILSRAVSPELSCKCLRQGASPTCGAEQGRALFRQRAAAGGLRARPDLRERVGMGNRSLEQMRRVHHSET